MDIQIKLNCTPESKDFPRCIGAALAATKLFNDYSSVVGNLEGIGPEGFAEDWMKACIYNADPGFRDKVMDYFLQILKSTQNG